MTEKHVSKLDQLKDWYYLSVLVCFAGVFGCYTGYGILQEELLADKKKKLDTSFVLGIQNVLAISLSAAIITYFRLGSLFGEFHKGDGVIGCLNFCSSYCGNSALKFVHYPVMALAKSAKILPVALTGWLLGVYKLTWT